MNCGREDCTGVHDHRRRSEMCPGAHERELEHHRKYNVSPRGRRAKRKYIDSPRGRKTQDARNNSWKGFMARLKYQAKSTLRKAGIDDQAAL